MGIYQFRHTAKYMKGLDEYLLTECFTRFMEGVELVNFTEDLDDEGLRAYKSRRALYTLSDRIMLRGTVEENGTIPSGLRQKSSKYA